MKERINELKTKMLHVFQQLTAKWKQRQADKKTDKKGTSSDKVGRAGSNFAKVLSGFKIVFNTLFILGFIGGLFGAGVAMGYGVALFDKAQVPQAEELVKQVKDIASISEITYSDGSTIASIEGDLLRTSVASDAISDNLKKAIVATEDEHFNEHKGVVPKAVIRATLGTFVGLGSSSGGSTLT